MLHILNYWCWCWIGENQSKTNSNDPPLGCEPKTNDKKSPLSDSQINSNVLPWDLKPTQILWDLKWIQTMLWSSLEILNELKWYSVGVLTFSEILPNITPITGNYKLNLKKSWSLLISLNDVNFLLPIQKQSTKQNKSKENSLMLHTQKKTLW